jgi:dipeptidyl aminopeptidase/acylaminoacyl peptidase
MKTILKDTFMKGFLSLIALLSLVSFAAHSESAVSTSDFIKRPTYGSPRISPNGDYLAITVDRGDFDVLVVLDVKTLKQISVNQLPDKKSVGSFYWVGPKRLMFTASRKFGRFAQPFGTGEWFAVDADGQKPKALLTGVQQSRTGKKKASLRDASYSLLETLPEDDTKIIMLKRDALSEDNVVTEVVSIDTYSGVENVLAKGPKGNCSITLDANNETRFAVCAISKAADGKQFEENSELYKLGTDRSWTLINKSQSTGQRISVLGTSKDGKIYATADDRKKPAAFGYLDQTTGAFKSEFQDSVADISNYLVSTDRSTIFGVVTEAGAPKVHLTDEQSADAQLYVSLSEAFPRQYVDFSSATLDGKQILVSVSSDKNPGELYLYDRDTKKARFLIRNRQWLSSENMADVKPVKIKSRDGIDLYGYLTIPKGKLPKSNLPLIINPHGGPIGPRDNWGFNWEAQLFASRGYAVLQLNFRGSGGYGQAFQDMGHMQWGGKMQDDLTDATQWAIKEGHADAKRICIYGGSYGGYASLMGPAKEQGLYQCAVGYVGVYDMPMMYTKGDISQRDSGKRFLNRTMGSDAAVLKAISPTELASKIKVPVFLAAGARDVRAPPEHTEAMRDALIKAGNPPEEVIIQSGEMHGFYEEANNLNLYTKMLAFFDKHIGDKKVASK